MSATCWECLQGHRMSVSHAIDTCIYLTAHSQRFCRLKKNGGWVCSACFLGWQFVTEMLMFLQLLYVQIHNSYFCSVSYLAFIATSCVCTFLFYSLKLVLSFLLHCNFKLIQQWGSRRLSSHRLAVCLIHVLPNIWQGSLYPRQLSCISSRFSCISQIFF